MPSRISGREDALVIYSKSNSTCQLFLSQMREIFRLVMTGISENVTATSEDFRRRPNVSGTFRRCSDEMVSSPSNPNAKTEK